VQPLELGVRRHRAELRLLDAAAARADEVVMVRRAAPDVDVPADGEPADRPVLSQELDRAVRRCEAEPRVQVARASMQLSDREAAAPIPDELQHRPARCRHSYVIGQREHENNLHEIDSHSLCGRRLERRIAWRRLEDVSLAAGRSWAPPVPARAQAPRPGAFLLGASDISSASGLDPASLQRALVAPAAAEGDGALLRSG